MKPYRWLVAPLLAIALLLVGTGIVAAQAAVTVSGTVTDAGTSTPIAGATVTIVGSVPLLSATTGATGTYAIVGVATGTYDVSASAPGYNTATLTNVSVPDAGATGIDFALTAATPVADGTTTVAGTVTDAGTASPVQGATVAIVGSVPLPSPCEIS